MIHDRDDGAALGWTAFASEMRRRNRRETFTESGWSVSRDSESLQVYEELVALTGIEPVFKP